MSLGPGRVVFAKTLGQAAKRHISPYAKRVLRSFKHMKKEYGATAARAFHSRPPRMKPKRLHDRMYGTPAPIASAAFSRGTSRFQTARFETADAIRRARRDVRAVKAKNLDRLWHSMASGIKGKAFGVGVGVLGASAAAAATRRRRVKSGGRSQLKRKR